MLKSNISLKDFKNCAGTELVPSGWLLIDQHRIDQFADATNDHQFIHVDPEKAAETPFGCTIAHGFLSMSLITTLVAENMLIPEGAMMGINYGSDKVRFIQPIKVNTRVRAQATIKEVTERRGGQFIVKVGVTIEREDHKRPALMADILSLYLVKQET
jgi:acyl dehydratase